MDEIIKNLHERVFQSGNVLSAPGYQGRETGDFGTTSAGTEERK
jgi:hypothetical protein